MNNKFNACDEKQKAKFDLNYYLNLEALEFADCYLNKSMSLREIGATHGISRSQVQRSLRNRLKYVDKNLHEQVLKELKERNPHNAYKKRKFVKGEESDD